MKMPPRTGTVGAGWGCFSAVGVVLAVALLLGTVAWIAVAGPGMFSPGQLSTASKGRAYGGVSTHAQLARDCGACHSAPWSSKTMADKCLACHTEVATQLADKTGVHSRMLGGMAAPTCRGCHTEHQGANGALTVLDPMRFPHDLTGYSLRGHWRTAQGTRFTCQQCHNNDLAHFDQAVCATCHERMNPQFMSRHEKAFGKTCLLCHNGASADGSTFDHNSFAFKLSGKHASVPCEQCHLVNGPERLPQNTPQDCYSCHAKDDKHSGTFGKQCGQCHTPDGWKGAKVDHAIFPVSHGSREQTSTCTTCHPNGVTTYTCFGCHAHTPANVVARHEGRPLSELNDCIRCHAGGRREGGD